MNNNFEGNNNKNVNSNSKPYNINSYKPNRENSSSASGAFNKQTSNKQTSNFKDSRQNAAVKSQKKGAYAVALVIVALVCAIFGGAFGGAFTYYNLSKNLGSNLNNNYSNISIDDSYKSSVEAIAAKDLCSVVGIQITATANNFNRYPWNQNSSDSSTSVSEGSGIIYKSNGYIVTNYHVISSAVTSSNVQINVYLNSDSQNPSKATVVGYDAGADLAVIKIDAANLTAIEFGNSDNLRVGEVAVAIGNPGGMNFAGSVSQGIISGLDRTITLESGVEMKLIQTDASINPGNSGGALVDGSGNLIGISSAKLADTNYEGMGFAIPSNVVKSIADKLISQEGKATPYLGITMDSRYTASILSQYGLPSGVVVASVVDGTSADIAGIKSGDIITKCAGTSTQSADVLKSVINNSNVGDTIQIEVYRDGKTMAFNVTLGVQWY